MFQETDHGRFLPDDAMPGRLATALEKLTHAGILKPFGDDRDWRSFKTDCQVSPLKIAMMDADHHRAFATLPYFMEDMSVLDLDGTGDNFSASIPLPKRGRTWSGQISGRPHAQSSVAAQE
ncbi:MAG: hypothetical protein QM813_16450 [Verrucomicrobiota bacterium]